ncbi:uncharacterized protein LOC114643717 [Erpetoichthys calabaricus]|uniref:uncharacterized protein LOC114643717 n=1 Tax=Erpetoichthys calabaricus TaxID=27687 RepID=UPI00223410C0|nr:uncharacterized protein LOC114643717 [Erpetoichthys calabaricus]
MKYLAFVHSVLLDDPVVKQPVPIPPELLCLVQELAATQLDVLSTSRTIHSTTATMSTTPLRHQSKTTVSSVSQQSSPLLQTTGQAASQQAIPRAQRSSAPLQYPGYDHDISHWNCSQQQKVWMKTELESMGLWPGSLPVRHPMKMVSLWRIPPQPELIDCTFEFPLPKYFQLHPFFIWKPENDNLMGRLRNNYALPCLQGCSQPHIVSAGVGRPRVVVGINGQYYLFASRLSCRACKKRWYADNLQWLEKLPQRFTNTLPAIITYKKAICKTVMDELRRAGKSPNDMANQVMEMMHLKYERAHLAYLLSSQNIMDAERSLYGQRTFSEFLRGDNQPVPFGGYEDSDGWCGVSVSSYYLTDCLLYEYKRQEPAIKKLLQGTFGQALRSDHTRKVARKIASRTMSSYAVMNENWMILSWIMLQSETDKSLEPTYQGLANRYRIAEVDKANFQWVDRDCCSAFRVAESLQVEHLDWNAWKTTDSVVAQAIHGYQLNRCASRTMYNRNIAIKLDLFYCMRQILRECVSKHHGLYSSFCQFLSAAFSVVDQEDLQRLKDAYAFCGIHPANPTKQHIREHCRTKIPQSDELVKRVEEVFQRFYLAKDPNDVYLFKPSMLKSWRIQRVHILRGCLSDPELPGGILYRYGGTVQLNHVQGEGAKVPVWIPIRGTSQQEGYHFHQSQWVTGTQVSSELFQAQGMTGVARWNYQRLVDLQQPGVLLPGVFDPALISELNAASKRVTGEEKYPALHFSDRDTREKFGLEYIEPGYRPVLLDWDKHKKKTESFVLFETANEGSSTTVQALPSPPASTGPSVLFQFPSVADIKVEVSLCRDADIVPETEPPNTPSLSLLSLPASVRTGQVKTGGRVFVLDQRCWTSQMKEAIDNLIDKYHGQKDLLKLVDHNYAAMVQKSLDGIKLSELNEYHDFVCVGF